MAFSNYHKETSERSDPLNWAKQRLVTAGDYFFESIEGCNQNKYNMTTFILERACVSCDDGTPDSDDIVRAEIIKLEKGVQPIVRKCFFAKKLNCPFYYVLYCYEPEKVWVYKVDKPFSLFQTFDSFNAFSEWIYENKQWGEDNVKDFHNKKDLPEFDIRLRECKCGCPWPTNIDCVAFNKKNEPIAIIEFQNADKTEVRNHCNNYAFLFGQTQIDRKTGMPTIDVDVRRWKSQEILRLQAGLRFFIITWKKSDCDYIIKEVDKISFPQLPYNDKKETESIKGTYHQLMNCSDKKEQKKLKDYIETHYESYSIAFENGRMKKVPYKPVLSETKKSFPSIYYKYKQISFGYPETLPIVFSFFIDGIFSTQIK